jgi:signal transduction histidine kinase
MVTRSVSYPNDKEQSAHTAQKSLSLWERLTEAPAHITDREERHRNELLSAILLTLVGGGITAFIMVNFGYDIQEFSTDTWAMLGGALFSGITYFYNRTGRTERSALMMVIMLTGIFTVFPFVQTANEVFMMGGVVPAIFVSLFFAVRSSATVMVYMLIANQIMMNIFVEASYQREYFYVWVVLLITFAFLLVYTQNRVKVESIRREALLNANEKLRQSEATLEDRVADRTRDLEVASDLSKQVAGMLELDSMLAHTTERIATSFEWYRVSIFLYDEEDKILRYQAGHGDQPNTLPHRLRDLPINITSITAHAGKKGEVVLVNDVTDSDLYMPDPLLPDTRSELAIPMMVRGQLVGVLNVQSDTANDINDDDVRILTSIAEQLAVAVQTASLYGQQVAIAEELRAIDDLKSQFLASMSHELRTPLNAILNFTEFVMLGMLGDINDAQKDALGKSLESGRHLLSLINDVLDITKIESGKMKLFIEEGVELTSEIEQVCATAETLLERKKDDVQLVLDIDDNLPHITADRRRIRQVLLNLISNAVKFTEEGTVTFSVKNRGDEILFAVTDTGPGIAIDQHTNIFEPFVQTETGIQHEGGTGLGLPITKRLVEAHYGRIILESEVGQGASFYVTLPVDSPELRQIAEPQQKTRTLA